jgi:hypothetical protein
MGNNEQTQNLIDFPSSEVGSHQLMDPRISDIHPRAKWMKMWYKFRKMYGSLSKSLLMRQKFHLVLPKPFDIRSELTADCSKIHASSAD